MRGGYYGLLSFLLTLLKLYRMACEDNIIGLSQTVCSCYDDDKPADFDTSKSGLFLDELEGIELDLIKATEDCADGNLWGMMERAVANAWDALSADLLACISLRNDAKRKRFDGELGQRKFTSIQNIADTYAGVRFKVQWGNIEGGKLKIKTIGTLMDATTTITIFLYSNESTTPIQSWVVNATASTFEANDVADVTVELESDLCDDLEYYLIYEVGENDPFQPANNITDCGCNKKKQKQYESFISMDGISGDDLSNIEGFSQNTFANGLIVGIELWCSVSELICKDELNFVDDGWAKQLAYGLRFKAGDILIEDILASANINRYTMLDRERLWGKRNHFRKEYANRLKFLCDSIDIRQNDCLYCNDPRIGMGNIRA